MDASTKLEIAKWICGEYLEAELDEWWSDRYSDPDYQFIRPTLVVVGNWTNDTEVVSAWEVDPALENLERGKFYYVYDALDLLGCRMEWVDEWARCDKCGGAVRTKPSSAAWRPSYVNVGDDGVVCNECFRTEGFL